MLSLEKVSVSFGLRCVLDSVSWNLGTGERVALVGRNGAGKTTLFRVALGEIPPDDGIVKQAHHVRVGYLPQESMPLDGETALDAAMKAFDVALDAAREQEELTELIDRTPSDDPELLALLHRLDDLHHVFEHADGFRMESEAERVLDGLGFSPQQMRAPLETLSGGWRMRVHLARLLLSRPTHLFLDEPTNHLDLPSLAWLEEFLGEFSGTLVVISHDRSFLDRTVKKVVELAGGRLDQYPGNYSFYVEEKERRHTALLSAKLNQDRKVEQLERFIERFGAKNTKATQAKSKAKQLEKMERIEIETDPSSIHFRFDPAPRSGHVVVALRGAQKRFGTDPPLFIDLDLEIERGEKVAIVGPNGAGKSTLLRILAGTEPLDGGRRDLDGRAVVAFFAQHTSDGLDLTSSLFDELRRTAPRTLNDTRLRALLGAFLFSGDDINKLIGVLSGGEKARVAIAKTLVQPVNFLLLDEPTNHLDIAGKEMLAEALERYDGTLLLVTHDRTVIDQVATRVLEVNPGGLVRSYLGGFTDYADFRLREGRPLPGYSPKGAAVAPVSLARAPAGDASPAKGPPLKPDEAHRERRREERQRVNEEKRLVARLEQLEVEKAALAKSFEDPELYGDAARLSAQRQRHAKVEAEIATCWKRLERL